jgi:hypothetical protein
LLDEPALAHADEETRGPVFGHDEIPPPVVVDVPNRNSLPVARDSEPRSRAHVLEAAVRLLVEQLMRRSRTRTAVLHEEHVQSVVVVEVEQGAAAARKGWHEVRVRRTTLEHEVQVRLVVASSNQGCAAGLSDIVEGAGPTHPQTTSATTMPSDRCGQRRLEQHQALIREEGPRLIV